jgi:hypothetical protein
MHLLAISVSGKMKILHWQETRHPTKQQIK